MSVFIEKDEKGRSRHHVLVSEEGCRRRGSYIRFRASPNFSFQDAMEIVYAYHQARLAMYGLRATPVTGTMVINEFRGWCFSAPNCTKYAKRTR